MRYRALQATWVGIEEILRLWLQDIRIYRAQLLMILLGSHAPGHAWVPRARPSVVVAGCVATSASAGRLIMQNLGPRDALPFAAA